MGSTASGYEEQQKSQSPDSNETTLIIHTQESPIQMELNEIILEAASVGTNPPPGIITELDSKSEVITRISPALSIAKEELTLLQGKNEQGLGERKERDEKTNVQIAAQWERKEKLRNAVQLKQREIELLKREVNSLSEKLRPFPSVQLAKLKEENNQLRIECDLMAREVDKRTNGNVPLGETSENFYRSINPGQGVNALIRNMAKNPTNNPSTAVDSSENSNISGRFPTGTARTTLPPPRPPPPKYLPIPTQFDTSNPNGEWNCTVCTFKNHPDLTECEQCSMVRFLPSPNSPARGNY